MPNIDEEECKVVINLATYNVLLLVGIVCVSINLFIGIVTKTFGSQVLLSNCHDCFRNIHNIVFVSFVYALAMWILLSTVSSFGLIWTTNFILNTVFCLTVISGVSMVFVLVPVCADLFPTNYK